MQSLMSLMQFVFANAGSFLAAIAALLVALVAVVHAAIGLAMLIPGQQPEKFLQSMADALQKAVDFVQKYSAK